MIRSKLVNSAISLAVLCSASAVSASAEVAGKIVANPTAVVSSGAIKHTVANSAVTYIEGDLVTTGSEASASINLSAGNAKITLAPNTAMSVVDAEKATLSLTQGALKIKAEQGQSVVVNTANGSYTLTSETAINAIAAFENGEFSAISKAGELLISSQQGSVVTLIDSSNAFVSNGELAKSVNVQLAGGAAAGAAGGAAGAATAVAATTVAVSVASVAAVAVVADEVSDSGEPEPISQAVVEAINAGELAGGEEDVVTAAAEAEAASPAQ